MARRKKYNDELSESLFSAISIILAKQLSYKDSAEKYQLKDYTFPFSDKTIKLRKSTRGFIAGTVIFFALSLLIGLMIKITLPTFLTSFIPQASFNKGVLTVARFLKLIASILAIWTLWIELRILTYQIARQKLYERNVRTNDNNAIRLEKDILDNLNLRRTLYKELEAEKAGKVDEASNIKLEALKIIEDSFKVKINTREDSRHNVATFFNMSAEHVTDDSINLSVEQLLFKGESTSSSGEATKIGEIASNLINRGGYFDNDKKKIFFGNKISEDGTHFVRTKADVHYDPYYYDEKLIDVKRVIHNANVTHSFPYRAGTFTEEGVNMGLTDNTEKNRKNAALAKDWADRKTK
ncbi:hypothetical protein SUT38_11265, partial [Streptococcus agalactiae]